MSRPKKEAAPKVGEIKEKRREPVSRLRGMRDLLPDELKYFTLVTKKANELARIYSFKKIDTPILESLKLYERTSGKNTDMVNKEMYNFLDRGGDKIALRPEATPGIARAYVEHGMFNLPQPVKLCWIGPVFRYDKPQSGRYRQHHQVNMDVYGEAKPIVDAQLILIAYNFFKELQIDIQVQINSIGCGICRPVYLTKLTNYYKSRGKRAKLCFDCKKRLVKNPLRLLDCKEESCIAMMEDAPQIVDDLCPDCSKHFTSVLEYLDAMSVPYNLNPRLVRGLDYYNRTVFEFTPAVNVDENKDDRRQLALGGGGRYDGLVEYLGGRPTPAVGFGIGIERSINMIKSLNIPIDTDEKVELFIAQLGENAKQKAMQLFEEFRRAGYRVREAFTKDSLKTQLEEADRTHAKFSLILGHKELMDGTIIIRDMESGIQEIVDFKKIFTEVDKRLASKA